MARYCTASNPHLSDTVRFSCPSERHISNEISFKRSQKRTQCCDGRVVKAFDLKSNGIFPRRFESCSQRSNLTVESTTNETFERERSCVAYSFKNCSQYGLGCNGRVVKAFDSKSNGIFPRRFESYLQRTGLWLNYTNYTHVNGRYHRTLHQLLSDSPTFHKCKC